jgi:NADH-quinone oxidoreductase subunit G
MEGVPPVKSAAVFNSPWAPGWNSNQSVFKFQSEAGGPLQQSSQGERLLDNNGAGRSWYQPGMHKSSGAGFTLFPLYHLFGSEELTARSEAIQARATGAYIAINPADAGKLGLNSSDGVQVQHNGAVPFLLRESILPGTVGVSVGLTGLNFQNLAPTISLNKAADWQTPKDWRASNIIARDVSKRGSI